MFGLRPCNRRVRDRVKKLTRDRRFERDAHDEPRAGAGVGEDRANGVLLHLGALGDGAARAQSHRSRQTAEDADARNAGGRLAFQDHALGGDAGR